MLLRIPTKAYRSTSISFSTTRGWFINVPNTFSANSNFTEYVVVSICAENIKSYLVFGPLETAYVRRRFAEIDMKPEVKASSICKLFYPQIFIFVRAMHNQPCMCGQFVYNYDMFRCPRKKSIGGGMVS